MFDFFKKGFSKTFEALKLTKNGDDKISKEILEELLLEADISYEIIEYIFSQLSKKEIKKEELRTVLKSFFIFEEVEPKNRYVSPFVELILGVNGAGKTTTIAKLANSYKNSNKKVILGACDTFRAGAIEQLRQWSLKLDMPIVATSQGHDPAAVAYDTISSAIAKKYDNVLIDTAGRLQNQKNLSNELVKIVKICNKAQLGAPHRKLIVLDATQGNNSLAQAREFNNIVKIDGIVLTKLDGTPKGGVIFAIAKELKIPILYIGVGEGMNDLQPFNEDEFINALLDEIYS